MIEQYCPVNAELIAPFDGVHRHPDAGVFFAACRVCDNADALLVCFRPFRATCRRGCSRMRILRTAYHGRKMTSAARIEVLDAARAAAKSQTDDSRAVSRLCRWIGGAR